MTSLRDIRSTFLDFFKARDHLIAPSAPLVPDDPTLLFVNAGMVPFKNVFTGVEPPPAPRAASSQKCVRAGGKHNDLDNVGYTARHHTFFEMLGNFSFGDYFKEQAIVHAWDLVTKEFALRADRLVVTVYSEDAEARALWRKVSGLDDARIISIGTSDNFWSMGDTGPCGPCSEIFYDHGPDVPGGPPGSPDEDGDRFIEIWNLVFMQYDQRADGERGALPRPSIDTGMGLERIAAVLQGVHSNYDVDLFKTLIAASQALVREARDPEEAASHRVIADHLRAASFLIADGVSPSNEGRGYVLRRIMRRAMRHAHVIGAEEPLMYRLAPTLIEEMGDAFGELRRAQAAITETLRQEEEQFRRTLANGLALLDKAAGDLAAGDTLPGAVAFKLYDTYGFPLDLTQDALKARGVAVDTEGFDAEMARQKREARAHWAGSGAAGADADWIALTAGLPATEFLGYAKTAAPGRVALIVRDGAAIEAADAGDEVEIVFDQTPFYAESGGQVGDVGTLAFANGGRAEVLDTRKRGEGVIAHRARLLSGALRVGDEAKLVVDAERRAKTRANHSATHLLHAALRRTLGPHVTQKGSYVGPDRLRFDFSHGQPLTPDEISRIENEVNEVVLQNAAAKTQSMAPQDAIAAGALALFGEKYGDEVRVLTLGKSPERSSTAYSVELCGGTHVARTGDIGLFKIVGESAVASGVRRIEAMTGLAAKAWLDQQAAVARALSDLLKTPVGEAEGRLAAVLEERRSVERALSDAKKQLALGGSGGGAAAAPETVAGVKLLARVSEGVKAKDLRALVDQAKSQLGSGVAAFIGVVDGKAALAVGVTADLAGRIDARELARAGAAAVGGAGGGGRPDMAQAGGPDGANAEAAVEAIRAALESAAAQAA